jgi:effector-binding domain-containing protein
MPYNCELFDIPHTPLLSIRTHAAVQDLPGLIGPSYGAIMQYLAELQEAVAGEPFVIYYNLDMQNLDIEIGFPVTKALPGKGQIQSSEMPAGPTARALFTGPYSEMAPAYDELKKFVEDSGREPTGVAIEYYLNGPETPPEKLETRIVFPLKK